jgi:hypothetical protein
MTKSLASCADCANFEGCPTAGGFLHRDGYKYRKYLQALDFIRSRGYDAFFETADRWTNAYGKY